MAAHERIEVSVRKLQSYINRYGPDAGPKLYHALQSQAAHAGVSARLRRKIERLNSPRAQADPASASAYVERPLFPLFEDSEVLAPAELHLLN